MKKQIRIWLALLLCAAVLGGCAPRDAAVVQMTLPPAPTPALIPENDGMQASRRQVLFYLPGADGLGLKAVPGEAELSISEHSAETMCQLLFAHPGTEDALPLGREIALSNTHGVEVSGDVATVNLSSTAYRLETEDLFAVSRAITNTLCQFGDIRYVNVLVAGVQPGLDVAASVPAGCFTENIRDDLSTLYNRALAAGTGNRFAVTAALYYPAAGARGVLCEGRTLSFTDWTPAGMMETLLEALQMGAAGWEGLPVCPDFSVYMTERPQVQETNGTRRAVLRFDESFNGAIIDRGITRSVMVASLVYTITTFMPGLDGVEIHIGDEMLTSLTPSGTYTGAGQTITFENGLMRRSDFAPFLLSGCTLYFENEEGLLQRVTRAVPFHESRNVRSILGQMMAGSQPYDSVENLLPVLPDGVRDADLMGIAFHDETLVLNFSRQFASLCQGMDEGQEERMVYAICNALCHLQGVKKVQFLVDGSQPDTLAGHLYLPGVFLPNEDIMAP